MSRELSIWLQKLHSKKYKNSHIYTISKAFSTHMTLREVITVGILSMLRGITSRMKKISD